MPAKRSQSIEIKSTETPGKKSANKSKKIPISDATTSETASKKSKSKQSSSISPTNSFVNEQKQEASIKPSTESMIDSFKNLNIDNSEQNKVECKVQNDCNVVVQETDINTIVQSAVKSVNEKINNSNFYLYDDIMKYIDPNAIIDKKDQQILLKNIKLLDQNGINLVYVLLKMFYIKNSVNDNVSAQLLLDLPYQGKVIKEHNNFVFDLEFDIKKIPNKAQLLLYHFTLRHLKSLNILKTF
jgi:hypothetical protein